ncbi:hypothetical protein V8C34DRAFT_50400 [Trichoderma compactum]
MYNVVPDAEPRQNTKAKTEALLSFSSLSRLRMEIEIASKGRSRARNTLRALRTRTWAALRYLVPRAGAGTPYPVQEIRRRPQNTRNQTAGFPFPIHGLPQPRPLVSTNKRSARGAQHRWLVRAGRVPESESHRPAPGQHQALAVLPAASTGPHQGSPFYASCRSRARPTVGCSQV